MPQVRNIYARAVVCGKPDLNHRGDSEFHNEGVLAPRQSSCPRLVCALREECPNAPGCTLYW